MPSTDASPQSPLLVYDGDCGFCAWWVRYWQRMTGDRVRYAPYQEVAQQYPAIPLAEFRRAVQLIAADGSIRSGAAATFGVLSQAPGRGFWLWLYQAVPGFATASEALYRLAARHRERLFRPTLWLWGREPQPAAYSVVSWLFLRALALIYLAAFVSLGVQVLGLVGSDGILPAADFLASARALGPARYWDIPTVFWLSVSDATLQAACWAGAIASVTLLLGVFQRTSLIILYLLYLSLFYAGQIFTGYQWDVLLLEAGFLAIFLPTGSRAVPWLMRWLLFRFMLGSGVVKLASHDPTWANLTALSYHFQTQPLPTPVAWYANQLPGWFLQAAVVGVFIVELILPFFVFLPRRARGLAAWGFLLLQGLILLTGNYNFFNLLAMSLCLFLFDDQAFGRVLPNAFLRWIKGGSRVFRIPFLDRGLIGATLVCAVLFGGLQLVADVSDGRLIRSAQQLYGVIEPLHIVNPYGVFAVMTTRRLEIIVEGSMDGTHWKPYRFRYKPGDINRAPTWNIPHQPRLDWQMWFAALGPYWQSPWFDRFLDRLLQNAPPVAALLRSNPFPDTPPRYLRTTLYEYQFSDWAIRHKFDHWWIRRKLGAYGPTLSR